MRKEFLSFLRVMLILLLLSAGAVFLFLYHVVHKSMKKNKLSSDADMIGSALMGYRRDNDDALPGSFSDLTFGGVNIADYRHYYDGGRREEIPMDITRLPDKKIDLEFFTLYPPGTKFGKSGKEVFAIGKRKRVTLLHVIYVDGSVGFEMER